MKRSVGNKRSSSDNWKSCYPLVTLTLIFLSSVEEEKQVLKNVHAALPDNNGWGPEIVKVQKHHKLSIQLKCGIASLMKL